MESPRNETSVARANKEKGRREKATRGTVVGFKLCDCPGAGISVGESNDVWEPLQKEVGRG